MSRYSSEDALKALVTVSFGIDSDEVVSWVRDNYAPDDVFQQRDLDAWAEENDYIKKEG
jgi:hypothetical protein